MSRSGATSIDTDGVVKGQVLPIFLTVVTFVCLVGLLWLEVRILNITSAADIVLKLRVGDVLLGMTIYLKTSIDFAVFIARLMETQVGSKSRIAIEIGTAVGNAAGTMLVLALWSFFKDIEWLLAAMILIAALVLLRLAAEGFSHTRESNHHLPLWLEKGVGVIEWGLGYINAVVGPVLRYIVPQFKLPERGVLRFWRLLGFAFTIPFILGLDDFAGYVPVFDVVNVYGFAVGVFAGHMVLNVFLYLSPVTTVRVIKNPFIGLVGSLAFIGLAIWGIVEVVHLII